MIQGFRDWGLVLLRRWIDSRAATINHKAVIKDVYLEVDISAGYFLMLTIANLIALTGLVTNNVAVIIGAMLISPLMGPILSSGFAFITGDSSIGTKALKKVGLSILITLAVAAFATYLSPLKEVTEQILARTRPNLYDLAIAILAGTAGAIAICTKKGYITIVTGVAIATAVIPPLSVAGYGLGIWHLSIAFGGFILFFTNFVAIILATCIVFYTFGFKPGITVEGEAVELRKRIYAFAGILLIISIPLINTLRVSIIEARLRNSVGSALKLEFNKERRSRVASFSFIKREDDLLEIDVTVNTVKYLNDTEIKDAENVLKEYLSQDVTLDVEQILVRSGGLKEEPIRPMIAPVVSQTKSPEEVIKTSIEGAAGVAKKVSEKIDRIIFPSKVGGLYIGFSDETAMLSAIMRIKRDEPISEEQQRWIRQVVSETINMPVHITLETVPMFPPLEFKIGETALSDEMKSSLSYLKEIYRADQTIMISIEARQGDKERRQVTEERIINLRTLINDEYSIPADRVKTKISGRRDPSPVVKVYVYSGNKG